MLQDLMTKLNTTPRHDQLQSQRKQASKMTFFFLGSVINQSKFPIPRFYTQTRSPPSDTQENTKEEECTNTNLVDVSRGGAGAGVRHGDGLPEQLDQAVSAASRRRPELPHLSRRPPPKQQSRSVSSFFGYMLLCPVLRFFLNQTNSPRSYSLPCYARSQTRDSRRRGMARSREGEIFCLRVAGVAEGGWDWG